MTLGMKRLVIALIALFWASPLAAQIDGTPKVVARLVAEHFTVRPGGTVAIALEQKIAPGWHTYWINPGDVGQPTVLGWTLPAGWKAGALQWPYPKRLPVGPFMDYGYEGNPVILTSLTAPIDAKDGQVLTLKGLVSFLVCREVCIPQDAPVSVQLMIGGNAAERALIPVTSPWGIHYALGTSLDLYVAAKALATAHPKDVQFFPLADGMVKNTAPQTVGFAPDGLVLRLTPGKTIAKKGGALDGVLVLTSSDGSVQALSVHALPGPVPAASFERGADAHADTGFLLSLFFAFLGGLILNLMPCVLPILAMKAFALSSLAGRDRREAVRESLAYGLGAILSFLALGGLLLALRSGGAAIGWGFQLQEPVVVAAFALLMFGVGLNLSGVYEIAGFGGGESLTRGGGTSGSFFTGILAVAVAAPCTAPFMAAALGYALTQSAVIALGIFLALGIGFALPFVLIGLSPALMRALPKPGVWMNYLKQALAFAMYGTAAWLVWVLAQQAGANAVAAVLAAMVVAGFGAWIWGATRLLSPRGRGIGALATLVALAAAVSCLWFLKSAPPTAAANINVTGIPSEPYSETRLANLRAENRPVFINATAAWCITCLVNDETALSGAKVRQAFSDKHIAYLTADWTRRDPAITALLTSHGRSGVPLYLYYARGRSEPVVLPQILTEDEVLATLGAP
jgi:thiol:disulfide interchange protein DsbD